MASKKQVATVKETLPAVAEFPDDFEKDVDVGGKVSAADISMPFLRIMQGLSPQVDPDNAAYIKGVVPGDIVLTVLNKNWDGRSTGVEMVFCHYTRVFVEWRPTEAGGGIVNTYGPDDKIIATAHRTDKGKMLLDNGNELIETAYHAILAKVDGEWIEAVMPLKSTMLKHSRRMNSVLTSFMLTNSKGDKVNAPRWAQRFLMTTVKEQKADKSWSVPSFEPLGLVDGATYYQAKEWAMVADKNSNFAAAEAAQTPAVSKERSKALDDEVPF